MKNCLLSHKMGFIISALLLTSACSDVAFSPAVPDNEKNSLPDRNKTMSQSFTQGLLSKKLDVLVVVDNSISMAEEQQKMGDKINSFISTLHDVDWQIGITTTDVSDGKFGIKGDLLRYNNSETNPTSSYIITKSTPNYEAVFKSLVVRPESYNCGYDCASGDEQPIRAAIMAIEKRNSRNTGFFRNESDLGVLVLSDEDEKSTGTGGATSPEVLINTINSNWGDSKRLYSYGMIIRPGDANCLKEQVNGGSYGTFVELLAFLTKGLTGSICDADFGPTLGLLAANVRKLLDFVQLDYYPKADSIKITFSSNHETKWTLSGNRIYFTNPPPKDTVIKVDYITK